MFKGENCAYMIVNVFMYNCCLDARRRRQERLLPPEDLNHEPTSEMSPYTAGRNAMLGMCESSCFDGV